MTAIVPLVLLLAQAAVPPAADALAKSTAQVLLKEGTALYERGDFAGALTKFEAAYGVYPSPKLLFNIGQADRYLGRPVDALEAFERFLALTADAAPDILAEAHQSVADLKTKLGQIEVECSGSGAEVVVDGKTVGASPLAQPIWVTPGRHQIVIHREGYVPAMVNVAAGETQTIAFAPQRQQIPPAEAPTVIAIGTSNATPEGPQGTVATPHQEKNWWSGRKWYVWTAAGGTVAFAAGAIVAGLSANSRFNDLQSSCGQTAAGCSESQIDTVKSRAMLTNVLWVLAGASAVATGVSLYVDSREVGVSVALSF